MAVYKWTASENYPEKCIGMYDHDHAPNYLRFREGRELSMDNLKLTAFNEPADSPPTFDFIVPRERLLKYDCLDNTAGGAPLVNHRVRLILENLAPDDVQFFEPKLICPDGELTGYWLLNATHTIKGIDFEQSVYKKINMAENTFRYTFQYMAYKPNCMGNHHIAREEDYLGNLLVDETLKELFEKERITGARLVRPEDFYRPLSVEGLLAAERSVEEE